MKIGRAAPTVLVLVAMAALDLLADAHSETWWHQLPGFDLLFGFLGCAGIVIVSKALGKVWLQREEGFYDGGDP